MKRRISEDDFTKDWKLYEKGKQWNRRLPQDYYDTITTNWEFFNGNQWVNAEGLSDEFPQPVFNIIKRIIQFFISSMTTTAITGAYKPLMMRDDDITNLDSLTAKVATADYHNFLERIKGNMVAKDLLLDAAVTGDMAFHMYFDNEKRPYGDMFDIDGEICLELIDGNNLYVGNPNSRDIQSQPYVLIYGRGMIDDIKAEIKKWQKIKQEELNLAPDNDNEEQAAEAGKIEVECDDYGKVGYVICYRKKMGKNGKKTVHVTKSLVDQVIYEDIDTGLTFYPVDFNNWEHQKNQYHGRALCTDILPNQIFINRMFAMAMFHLQNTAFPKLLYDADRISGWSNAVASAIAIEGRQPGESMRSFAEYLQPATMSPQIIELINMTINYTKEMLGANDALLGNVNPEQASGASISVTAQQSGIPLENPKSNIYEMFENMMKIYADMAGTYYGMRPVVFDSGDETVGEQIVMFDFGKLKDMAMNVAIDVGATTYWSEIRQVQQLDNLLAQGMIEFADYLEALPLSYDLPNKSEILQKVKEKAQAMQMQPQAMPPMPPM